MMHTMTGTQLFGICAVGFGIVTLAMRFVAPGGFGKLAAMKEKWGDDVGNFIHFFAYSLIPIIVGLVILASVDGRPANEAAGSATTEPQQVSAKKEAPKPKLLSGFETMEAQENSVRRFVERNEGFLCEEYCASKPAHKCTIKVYRFKAWTDASVEVYLDLHCGGTLYRKTRTFYFKDGGWLLHEPV